ncbi:MAG TPA: hypothetical protein DCG69_00120 [Bacteroidales bacterium]|nr:hypothetical protein [Bacteroidales bacterium]
MLNRQKDYLRLRETYQKLIYKDFQYCIKNDMLSIDFEFVMISNPDSGIADIFFKPEIVLPFPISKNAENHKSEELNNFVFHMGMVELISYWKSACPSEVIVLPYRLNENQLQFWKKLYWNGLGEFFYTNGIETSEKDFMMLYSVSEKELRFAQLQSQERILVPIGGGKDSAVSLEILKNTTLELFPFIINPRLASRATVKQAEISNDFLLEAKRAIDPKLIELNQQGFLNGHTPFSAMLAFTALLQAYLFDIKYIALSNESSANEVSVANSHVNHQYSKSFEFENDFRNYAKTYITADIHYFSFLRPLSELQIACLFSKLESHHFSFRSCNVGSKTDSWCGNCPKCLFTYIILSPFLAQEKLSKMLGSNLLSNLSLNNSLKELRGQAETKPFECVGTIDEVNLALHQALLKQNYQSALVQTTDFSASTEFLFDQALKEWNPDHFLPEFLEKLLKQKLSSCSES